MPFFSVVIPTYNRATRLRQAVRSVLDQTFPDFEVLVMDDGSTDGTDEAVKGFADARIRFATSVNSGGPATPRNRGIDLAAAEWICFLDSDDAWHSDKLAQTRRAIQDGRQPDAICHDVFEVHAADGRKEHVRCGPFGPDLYRTMLLDGNNCVTSAMSIRKSFLDRHGLRFNVSPDRVSVEDYDLWLRMALAGARFEHIALVLGEYRVDDGISLKIKEHFANWGAVLRDHVYQIQAFEPNRDRLWRRAVVQMQVGRFFQLVRTEQRRAALMLAMKTLADSPTGSARYLLAKIRRVVQ